MSRADRCGHFAFVSMPAQGHVAPTLPLVAELVRRGHRVSYATGADTVDAVRAAGADPVPAPFVMPDHPPPAPGAAPPSTEELVTRIEAFAVSVERTFPFLVEHFRRDPPVALCGDAMTPVTALVARRLGLPHVALHPSLASNEHFSLRRDVMRSSPGAHVFETAFERIGERIAAYAHGQGLDFDAGTGFTCPGDLNLVFVPREFQPAAATFDESFVFLGPSLGDRADRSHWHPRDPDAPVLLISLGTVFNDRPEFFRTCAEAFADSGWQVVMATGDRTGPEALGPLPSNVEAHSWVPQVAVLSHAAGFVTHNGMNSTMEALYLGVPQVGVPQMPEQDANARRVEELGCGRRLDPATLEPATLRATLDAVVADPTIRASVDAVSRRLRSVDGPSVGADALEDLTAA